MNFVSLSRLRVTGGLVRTAAVFACTSSTSTGGNALIFVHGQFIDFFSKLKKKLLKHGSSYLRMFNSIAAVQKMSATVSDSGFVRFANIWWDKHFSICVHEFCVLLQNTFLDWKKILTKKKTITKVKFGRRTERAVLENRKSNCICVVTT